MANAKINTTLLDRAIVFAVKAHEGTERRGKGFPYIVHPMEAMEIVASITPDQELLAAAALHDTVEDTDTTIEEIRSEFGDRIASLVEAESDKFMEGVSEEDSWHARKQAAIDRLAAAPHDAKIVAMGDKLSNMRAIWRDYQEKGDGLWKIFHAKDKSDHEWHYRGLQHSLAELSETAAYQEFSSLLDDVFGPDTTPELIDMNDYEQSGEGKTAQSFNCKSDPHRMIKLYEDYIPKEAVDRELKSSKAIERLGVRIPKAYRLVTNGKRLGVEFERIAPKWSYARAIANHPEQLEQYAKMFAAKAKQLHSMKCNKKEFSDIKDFWRGVIAASGKYFNEEERARMLATVENTPDTDTCLHGDMHIGNIISDGAFSYWIDLADFRYGNPVFDLGMFYLVSKLNIEEMTREMFHMDNATIARVWDIFIRDYYPGRDPEEVERECAPYAGLMLVFFGVRDKLLPFMEKIIRETLLKD